MLSLPSVLITVLAPSASAVDPEPVRSAIEVACRADVVFVGARGSGESASAQGGLGPVVWSAYASMAGELATRGATVNAVAVDYAAVPVETLLSVTRDDSSFFASIADGVVKTGRVLDDFRRAPECQGKRLVLGGYSQGAMVIHRTLQTYALADRPAGLIAALLVADGDRLPGDGDLVGGARPETFGIGQLLPAVSGSRPDRDMAGKWGITVTEVCKPRDLVCSPEIGEADAGDPMRQIGGQAAVHKSYADTALVDGAARGILR
ncbi:cutinase family protein [Nocardia arizonensis]|uniref:cutinase family protein n=1 Tax=Nocardia arizonensis TaxID=1141647 RepID=UPI0006D02665|nr:cutinase family protein [Nocardia arizonensis]